MHYPSTPSTVVGAPDAPIHADWYRQLNASAYSRIACWSPREVVTEWVGRSSRPTTLMGVMAVMSNMPIGRFDLLSFCLVLLVARYRPHSLSKRLWEGLPPASRPSARRHAKLDQVTVCQVPSGWRQAVPRATCGCPPI
jgi:hypothetical protein